MSKLNYQQQKIMKKLLKKIGVEDFSLYNDVKEEVGRFLHPRSVCRSG